MTGIPKPRNCPDLRALASAFLALVALASTGLSTPAAAQAIYSWTDARGVVHYGDRAPANASAREVTIKSSTPPPVATSTPTTATPATMGAPAMGAPAMGAPAMGAAKTRTPPARPALSIVMYSRADCGFCAGARRFFAARGIPYREMDIDRYAQARAEHRRLGGKGVPLFVINGHVSRGFSVAGMHRRLARLGW